MGGGKGGLTRTDMAAIEVDGRLLLLPLRRAFGDSIDPPAARSLACAVWHDATPSPSPSPPGARTHAAHARHARLSPPPPRFSECAFARAPARRAFAPVGPFPRNTQTARARSARTDIFRSGSADRARARARARRPGDAGSGTGCNRRICCAARSMQQLPARAQAGPAVRSSELTHSRIGEERGLDPVWCPR